MIFFLINIIIISLIDFEILKSFFYTIVIFYLITYIFLSKEFFKNFLVLQLYVFLAILIFLIQKYAIPDWYGFSGDYGGVGTDDSRFYGGVTTNIASIPYGARSYLGMEHNFVTFLKFIYPFQINHPLSIIIPNLLGICFIPHFTYKASFSLTKDTRVSEMAFKLVLICPFILSNGLILMRDGWSAFFFILGLYHFLEGNFIKYIIALFFLVSIRLGSGLLLLIVPFFYLYNFLLSGDIKKVFIKVFLFILFLSILISFGLPFLIEYSVSRGISGFVRQEFVENFIAKADDSSIVYAIYNMPFYLKLPFGFIFFLFLPYLQIEFYTQGFLNIRNIMFTILMPILNIFYFKYFLSGLYHAISNNKKNIKKVIFIFFFLILIISQLSIQPRHKTVLMPFFYILVAYGFVNNTKISKLIGSLMLLSLILIQLLILFKF
jgi:hypothetical protein